MSCELVEFLRDLANSIEEGSLPAQDLRRVSAFHMEYRFQDASLSSAPLEDGSAFSRQEIMRFVCLGWYIYCCILSKEPLDDSIVVPESDID